MSANTVSHLFKRCVSARVLWSLRALERRISPAAYHGPYYLCIGDTECLPCLPVWVWPLVTALKPHLAHSLCLCSCGPLPPVAYRRRHWKRWLVAADAETDMASASQRDMDACKCKAVDRPHSIAPPPGACSRGSPYDKSDMVVISPELARFDQVLSRAKASVCVCVRESQ